MDPNIASIPSSHADPTLSTPDSKAAVQSAATAIKTEHREAYGTAKTENLRDLGLWRTIIPVVIVVFALTLFVVPLLILVPLLSNSINAIRDGNQTGEAQLLWIWVTMIVIEVAIWAAIARYLYKTFITQSNNYRRA